MQSKLNNQSYLRIYVLLQIDNMYIANPYTYLGGGDYCFPPYLNSTEKIKIMHIHTYNIYMHIRSPVL